MGNRSDPHGIWASLDIPLPGYHKEQDQRPERGETKAPVEGVKYDSEKMRFDLIPPEAEYALAAVLTFGAKKYAPDNWRKIEDKKSRYSAALGRHLNAWKLGEKIDSDSGLPHLWHALACMNFLVADTFEADLADVRKISTEK